MKHILSTIIIVFFFILPFYGQYCDMHDTTQTDFKSTGSGCASSLNYAPYPISEYTSTKKVRVAIHIFQDENRNGNFQDTQEHNEYLNNLISDVNNRFANLEMVSHGTSPHVPDAKIQIVLHDIYFYQNQNVWDQVTYESFSGFRDI